jgi:hypothetical protein
LKEQNEMLKTNFQGIEEEINGLRSLARGLREMQEVAGSSKQAAQLANAHMRAASRVVELEEANQKLVQRREKDNWAENLLAALDRFAIDKWGKPVSDQARAQALMGEGGTASNLGDEIVSVRDMLRNVLELAAQAQEPAEFIRMVETYGSGCLQLVRMLKKQAGARSPLEQYLRNEIDQAIKEWNMERG